MIFSYFRIKWFIWSYCCWYHPCYFSFYCCCCLILPLAKPLASEKVCVFFVKICHYLEFFSFATTRFEMEATSNSQVSLPCNNLSKVALSLLVLSCILHEFLSSFIAQYVD